MDYDEKMLSELKKILQKKQDFNLFNTTDDYILWISIFGV